MSTKCNEVGCAGNVAADGYCDTCGMRFNPDAAPPTMGAAAAPRNTARSGATASHRTAGTAGSAPTAASSAPTSSPAAGAACTESGCGGSIAADGYCNTCGMSAASAAQTAAASSMSSIAQPQSPGVSARSTSSARTGSSRRTSSTRRTGVARAGVGAGLVDVPDTPAGDPAAAVMTPEKVQSVLGTVPEDERNCAKCGKPVGRGTAERAGRPKGFCGTCRTEFDFHTNAPTLQPGELVAGQYEILGPLAHGGLGWIYLGRDKQVSDRWVVLKGLLNASDPDAAAAAVAERRFLAEIDHASIVNIYNFVTHAGAGYIVMEYVGGESLNSKLKARRRANNDVADPLPVPEAIAYVLGVLPAFSYLHDRGMVYNDLKPANVMAVGDSVKLIDLGAVMRADDMAAAIFGTEGFQAPEVAADGPSAASDIYTVGRTLAVLTLKFAFHAGKYQYALPSPADEPLFAKWESYYRFLLKATAPHPDDRFASIADMEDQLLGVLQEIVAVTRGAPVITASSHFGPDRIPALLADAADNGFQSTDADWRVLPRLKIDPEDPAAGFLVNLPDIEPQRVLELIASAEGSGQITATREVQLRRARCLIEMSKAGARATAAESLLGQVEADDPWDWRVTWLRGMGLLLDGRWHEAAGRFSQVWTDLPGEQAPMLAVALAAEREGEMERAAEIYTRVLQTDRTYVSAAFGLARCRAAQGDRGGAVNAYRAIPNSSSTYMEAQIAATRTMVDDSNGGPPTADELAAAAQNVERMQLDASERAKLSADILERALTSVGDGTLAETHSTRLFGHTLTEKSLRTALSDAYRNMARLTPDTAETHRLIDKANLVRPRTLL